MSNMISQRVGAVFQYCEAGEDERAPSSLTIDATSVSPCG
jgi:hypothetical protein